MKKIVGTVFAGIFALSSSLAFASENARDEIGMYGKLSIGFSRGGADAVWDFGDIEGTPYKVDTIVYYKGFEIVPALGLKIPSPKLEERNFSFVVEGSLGFTFGGDSEGFYESSTTVINPCLMAIFDYHFDALPKFVPYFGAGFSVPIQIVSLEYNFPTVENYGESKTETFECDSTEVGFKLNWTIGARYDVTEKYNLLAEFNTGFFGVFSWSLRFGGAIHLK